MLCARRPRLARHLDGQTVRRATYSLRVLKTPGNPNSSAPGLAVILAGIALIATGCGSSDEQFSRGEAVRADAALDYVQNNVEAGRCSRAQAGINRLATQASNVNDDRPELGEAWAASVARLSTLIMRECVEITPEGPTSGATTPETGPTKPVEPTEPTEPVKPPTDDNGGQDDGGTGTNPGGQDDGQDNGSGNQTAPDNSGGAAPGT